MDFTVASRSDVGRVRTNNEDHCLVDEELGLFIVADGMGGHEAGEVASSLAAQVVEGFINDTRDADLNQTWPFPYDVTKTMEANRLMAGFRLANRRVATAIGENAELKGMATTMAAVLMGPPGHAHVAHVGDSRVYLFRGGTLRQVTHDHSWVGEQVRAGLLTDSDAQRHPWRNVVTRAISGGEDPEVEIADVEVVDGDVLLICSDGLSSVVSLDAMQKLLTGKSGSSLEQRANALVDAANDAGGPDNITVVLVQVNDR